MSSFLSLFTDLSEHKQRPSNEIPEFIHEWFDTESMEDLARKKDGMLDLSDAKFEVYYLSHFTPYFEFLKPCMMNMHRALRDPSKVDVEHANWKKYLEDAQRLAPDESTSTRVAPYTGPTDYEREILERIYRAQLYDDSKNEARRALREYSIPGAPNIKGIVSMDAEANFYLDRAKEMSAKPTGMHAEDSLAESATGATTQKKDKGKTKSRSAASTSKKGKARMLASADEDDINDAPLPSLESRFLSSITDEDEDEDGTATAVGESPETQLNATVSPASSSVPDNSVPDSRKRASSKVTAQGKNIVKMSSTTEVGGSSDVKVSAVAERGNSSRNSASGDKPISISMVMEVSEQAKPQKPVVETDRDKRHNKFTAAREGRKL